eukprot:GHVT01016347.1.p1 GENE.GHVT01016347.1~~GHVT01016347.1.p1  ORF type:complete len:505 (+),score=100.32 GHVT01016347.1:2456-3970(+)
MGWFQVALWVTVVVGFFKLVQGACAGERRAWVVAAADWVLFSMIGDVVQLPGPSRARCEAEDQDGEHARQEQKQNQREEEASALRHESSASFSPPSSSDELSAAAKEDGSDPYPVVASQDGRGDASRPRRAQRAVAPPGADSRHVDSNRLQECRRCVPCPRCRCGVPLAHARAAGEKSDPAHCGRLAESGAENALEPEPANCAKSSSDAFCWLCAWGPIFSHESSRPPVCCPCMLALSWRAHSRQISQPATGAGGASADAESCALPSEIAKDSAEEGDEAPASRPMRRRAGGLRAGTSGGLVRARANLPWSWRRGSETRHPSAVSGLQLHSTGRGGALLGKAQQLPNSQKQQQLLLQQQMLLLQQQVQHIQQQVHFHPRLHRHHPKIDRTHVQSHAPPGQWPPEQTQEGADKQNGQGADSSPLHCPNEYSPSAGETAAKRWRIRTASLAKGKLTLPVARPKVAAATRRVFESAFKAHSPLATFTSQSQTFGAQHNYNAAASPTP